MTAIVWFRRDLRLADNPALQAALKEHEDILPVYILDETLPYALGSAQHWWLHHSLFRLADALNKKAATLILKRGDSQAVLAALIKKYKVQAVYFNRVYEPVYLKQDAELEKLGIEIHSYNASLLTEPESVKNKSGAAYKVFTPYYRTVLSDLQPRKLYSEPRQISQKSNVVSDSLSRWKLLPQEPDWSKGFSAWTPGERGAHQALKQFIKDNLQDYSVQRDRPDMNATSHLSPYLHFGEISPWQIYHSVKQETQGKPRFDLGSEMFLRQLVWREFAYYLLYHFPQLDKKNYNSKFDNFSWQRNKKHLTAWQQGLTGYPIVDAGMRELWHTGYMQNRVRMIVASFLTKHLLIDWREGAKWFFYTLLDADLANNALGWQWVAGSGPDAAPYFRIFNPTLQGKKFDSHGDYVRRWCPELGKLSNKYIHEPSLAPQELLQEAGVELGKSYPLPLVDHRAARDTALALYKRIK